jgi:hypothetical protein
MVLKAVQKTEETQMCGKSTLATWTDPYILGPGLEDLASHFQLFVSDTSNTFIGTRLSPTPRERNALDPGEG